MSDSLKEQLLKLGLGTEKRAEAKPRRRDARPRRTASPPPPRPVEQPRPPGARQQRELDRERQARQQRLRERVEAIKLDDAQADVQHYYLTGRKIKRIYVTQAQQAALLRGEILIIVVQGKGRLVPRTLVESLLEIDPEARIVDPSKVEERGADGDASVPDDLRW